MVDEQKTPQGYRERKDHRHERLGKRSTSDVSEEVSKRFVFRNCMVYPDFLFFFVLSLETKNASSLNNFLKGIQDTLPDHARKFLQSNKNIILVRADKGHIVIDTTSYDG